MTSSSEQQTTPIIIQQFTDTRETTYEVNGQIVGSVITVLPGQPEAAAAIPQTVLEPAIKKEVENLQVTRYERHKSTLLMGLSGLIPLWCTVEEGRKALNEAGIDSTERNALGFAAILALGSIAKVWSWRRQGRIINQKQTNIALLKSLPSTAGLVEAATVD